jgi:hypothetical protein
MWGWVVLLTLVIGSIASGLLIGRWVALVIPAVVIPLFYIGLRYGWWGYGVGDGWQYIAVAVTIVVMAATGTVVLSRAVRR